MFKSISSAVIAATLLSAAPALATTLDFEAFITQQVVTAGTDLGGISFDQDIQVGQFGFLDGPATDNWIARRANPSGGSVSGTFTSAVTSLTVGAGDACCDLDTVTLRGFDANGALVDSAMLSSQASAFLTISGSGIVGFEIVQASGGFDNLSFTAAAVPLPAGLPMLAGALGVFAWLRRRR